MRTLEERFWSKVKKSDSPTGCWEWQGYRNPKGYGMMWDGEGVSLTHRVSWRLHKGEESSLPLVLHSCDNPPCIRFTHLFAGTHILNMQDRQNKNRQAQGDRTGTVTHPERYPRGSQKAKAKLNETKVRTIRKLRSRGWSQGELAKRYQVSHNIISLLLRGKTWKHVSAAIN